MGPVPEQVLPGTSTGPLNKVNTLPQPFGLGGRWPFRGGYPKAPGQEDPDPSPQRVQGPGGLRPGQAGGVLKKLILVSVSFVWPAWPFLAPLAPPGPPWPPLAPPGPWPPLGPPWRLLPPHTAPGRPDSGSWLPPSNTPNPSALPASPAPLGPPAAPSRAPLPGPNLQTLHSSPSRPSSPAHLQPLHPAASTCRPSCPSSLSSPCKSGPPELARQRQRATNLGVSICFYV